MKYLRLLPAIALGAFLSSSAAPVVHGAAFTPGNLAVLRVGDGGVTTLANNATNLFILEYTPGGSLIQTISIPASGATALTMSGSATSEGALMRSPNGRWLCIGGYNTNSGPAGIASTTSLAAPRGVATIDAAGNYNLVATTSTQFSGNNIRAGATDGTNNFWAGGGSSGTYLFGFGATAGTIQSSIANSRVLSIFNGALCFSAASGTARGVYGFSPAGMPVAATPTNFLINAG